MSNSTSVQGCSTSCEMDPVNAPWRSAHLTGHRRPSRGCSPDDRPLPLWFGSHVGPPHRDHRPGRRTDVTTTVVAPFTIAA
ncbi:hypothetical protein ACFYOT_27670 [Saccharothrix saharensis]|uniref:hypothetical protein n=1 Tax=Saccharothrix saharensis TaxID=571190 RepID=UPI0036B760AB